MQRASFAAQLDGRTFAALSSLAALSAGRSLAASGHTSSTFASALASATPTVRELVGQRFVVAMSGTSPSSALLGRIRRGEIGGVILFGSNVVSRVQLRRLTSTLQGAAREAHRPPLLIATDQEGGRVRRLPWAGPVPSATELGRLGTSRIRAEATAAGKALRLEGVNVDLAPVGDLPGPQSFMALDQRTFGSTAASVAEATVAFVRGLAAARVAATVKHFPGIGRATRNTDQAAVEISATRADLAGSDLLSFRSAIGAGTPIVMISNATYPALDAKPAPWSTRVQSLLRRDLGFTGVTISDALDGAAATRGRTLPSVAALTAEAGVDLLLLVGSEASSAAAFERVVGSAERGRISAAALQLSYGRIMELKRAYG
jgi:beta-N-acetylhexosaminidase